jgi:hypothetical protein
VSTDFILERQDNTHSAQGINNGNNNEDDHEDEVFDVTPKQGKMHLLLISIFPPPFVDLF